MLSSSLRSKLLPSFHRHAFSSAASSDVKVLSKKEIIRTIAKDNDLTYAESGRIVQGVFDMITSSVSNGGRANISGFGSFYSKRAAAKSGFTPLGKSYSVEARDVVKFRAGKALKNIVAGH